VHAIEYAIKNHAPEGLEGLVKFVQDYKNYQIQIYDRKKLLLDAAFHSQIASLFGNLEIVKQLKRIFEHIYLRSPVELIPPSRLPTAASQHEQILQLIKKRDIGRAKECLRKHIQKAKEARRAMLSALPSINISADSM
jgi:DNA-binding GntR family transcriptional regulator